VHYLLVQESGDPFAFPRTLTNHQLWPQHRDAKLNARISRVRPKKKITLLLQHNKARTHTGLKTVEHIVNLGWTVVSHRPYSPDLAPSDFHLFGPMKDGLRGATFFQLRRRRTSCETVGHFRWCRFLQARHADSCSSMAEVYSQCVNYVEK